MRKIVPLLLILIIFSECAYAQQCLVNTLTVNTGFDPNTNAVIAPNNNDPKWKVTPSPAVLAANTVIPANSPASVIASFGPPWTANTATTSYLNCYNQNFYITNSAPEGTYYVDYSREFVMCQADSITFNLDIACDDYFVGLNVDNLNSISQTLPGPPYTQSMIPNNYTFTLFLPAGTHSIGIRVQNRTTVPNNSNNFTNQTGFFCTGNLSALSNSIVSELSSCSNYVCQNDTVINHYAAVQSHDTCSNTIAVDDASDFSAGDTILMIQMKGAVIDSSNSASFGNILNYNNAGNYEENIIQSIVGNVITLQNNLLRTYSIPKGRVQIVSVPQFTNYTVSVPHTAMQWDGTKGGIFAMNVLGTLTLNADIDVSELGFRGGTTSLSSIANCNATDYFYPATSNGGGHKGEGITEIQLSKIYGRGKLASGGGGGNSHNAGGGGGSNAGMGGQGGNQYNWVGCPTTYIPVLGGIGGTSLSYSNAANRIFLGGGGGSGHANNQGGNNGGIGGGIIYLQANTVISNGAALNAAGANANYANVIQLGVNDDGGNGGGAAGTVLLNSNNIVNNLSINIVGGNGSDAHTATTAPGPGGGGGGGVFWTSQVVLPANVVISNLGGQNGVVPQVSNTPFGSQPGQAGQSITGLNIPKANIPFVPFNTLNAGIDTTICSGQTAQLNASGASIYSWSPTNVSNPNISNPTATPAVTTSYVVTGQNALGCIDQDTVVVNVTPGPTINVSSTADTICVGDNVTLTASGATSYSWTGGVTNGSPFAPTSTATYTVTGTDAGGCIGTSTYTITVLPPPVLSVTPAQPIICRGDTVFFNASGATSYSWSPATSLNNPNISNPYSTANTSITYTVIGSTGSCTDQVTVNVTVSAAPTVVATASKNPVCAGESVVLNATGANTYSWSGGVLNGVSFIPNNTATYTVSATDANGCSSSSSILVTVNPNPIINVMPEEPVMCGGDSIFLQATGALRYLWSPSSTLSSPTKDTTWASPTFYRTYTIIGFDANNCRGTTTKEVEVINDFDLDIFKSDDIYCNTSPVQLSVNGGFNYTWSPAASVSNATISNPTTNINKTTTFYVQSKLGSCSGLDSITVFFYDNSESGLFIPNAFSPNGDGRNDCFRVVSQGNYDFYEFYIYNRWGQPVFESGSTTDCWNGNFKGEPVPVGSYYYYMRAKGECGEVFKKGDIIVIR